MRIIPKNTKVSTEFFKGVTLADMAVGFVGVLIIFLIAISSLPYRGYIAIGFAFILVFLLVRIDDESNYMFLFRIIRHFSYFRSYRKPGFEYPEMEEEISGEEPVNEALEENGNKNIVHMESKKDTPETSSDVAGDMPALENKSDSSVTETSEETKENEITEKESKENKFPENESVTHEKEKPEETLHSELEEDGFEIIDLDQVSEKKESVAETKEDKTADSDKKKHRKVFGKNKK